MSEDDASRGSDMHRAEDGDIVADIEEQLRTVMGSAAAGDDVPLPRLRRSNRMAAATEEFLGNFDPSKSEREKRKQQKKKKTAAKVDVIT